MPNIVVTIVSFVVVLGILVFIHELGHFLVAKRAGITVEEFGLGYPPRVATLAVRNGTEYTLNALPIGGFVRMVDEEDPSKPGSFASKGKLARALVLLAGPGANLLFAMILFPLTFMLGVPTPAPGVLVAAIAADSPAAQAGLHPNDLIVAADGQKIETTMDLRTYTESKLGQNMSLTVVRDSQQLAEPIVITPRSNPPEGQGPLGVSIEQAIENVSKPWYEAIPLGIAYTGQILVGIVSGLVEMVRGTVQPDLAGPVGIADLTGRVAQYGIIRIMSWMGLLSVNLAVVNLLPIPALDGGRLLFIVIEFLRGGKRVDPKKERLVHALGMALLLSLVLVISYFDVLRIFTGQSIVPR